MPAIWIPRKFSQDWDDPGAQRIEMEVPHQLKEIRLFLYDDRLIAILKQVPASSMASVEDPRVAREERPHAPGQRAIPRADEEVEVIRQEGPRVDGEGARLRETRQASDEVIPVAIIPEDELPIESSRHHMVQDPRSIESWSARHGGLQV
jgi:hypothetical protein